MKHQIQLNSATLGDIQLKSELHSRTSKSHDRRGTFKEGYANVKMNVTAKVGGFIAGPLSNKNGKLASIGEQQINHNSQGKKLINYSNYTLNPDNIINAQSLTQNKNYSNFMKEQIFDYKKDIQNEMREELQNHHKFTSNLKSIHAGQGSYHLPPNPGFKKPVFRGQNIFIDEYKQILRDRQQMNQQMKSYVIQNKKEAFSPLNKSNKISELSKSQMSNKYNAKLAPLDTRPSSQMKNTATATTRERIPLNLQFLQSNNEKFNKTQFLNKEINVEVKDPQNFFKILDKTHTNVVKASEKKKTAVRDWDLFKPKSQMSKNMNSRNLEAISKKPDSLSVMGHQKDVKENAYSQISARITYRNDPETKSVPKQRTVKVDAEKQLNLINLDKLSRPNETKSQLDAISQITKTIPTRVRSATKSRAPEDEEILSKRWKNLENFVQTKKSRKIRKLAKGYANTLKARDNDHILEEPAQAEITLDEGDDPESCSEEASEEDPDTILTTKLMDEILQEAGEATEIKPKTKLTVEIPFQLKQTETSYKLPAEKQEKLDQKIKEVNDKIFNNKP